MAKVTSKSCTDTSLGSAFFIDTSHLLTAAHVVDGATRIAVRRGNAITPATVIGFSSRADVAMLQVKKPLSGKALTLAQQDPSVGSPVVAIGYPDGGALTSTRGRVDATEQVIRVEDGVQRGGLVRTTALVSPGNSGGPLVGLDGQVYGLVHAGDLYDTEYGWAVSPVLSADLARAWLADPQSYPAPDCSSGDTLWADETQPAPAPPVGGGEPQPNDWPAYEYTGPGLYDVCQQATYPLPEQLKATREPNGDTPEYWTIVSVQAALRALNYGKPRLITVDGAYGRETAQTVRRFQARKGLTVDGIVGPETWNMLNATVNYWRGLCP